MNINSIKEQQAVCNKCKAPSMEWCIFHQCPYWIAKDYTDEDRKKYQRIMGN